MSEQDNVQIALKTFERFNARDVDAWREFEAENYVFEGTATGGAVNGAQARMYAQNFINAFPDLHFDITHTIAQGDYVVLNWTATGTHTGPLDTPSGGSIPPTHKKAMTHGSNTFEFKNGKLVRNWTYWDLAGLLVQLGLMPPM